MDESGALTQIESHLGSLLWIGLVAYVLSVDVYALATGKETLSEALSRGLRNPRTKWLPILAWGLTSKHLFFRSFYPQVDPFNIMAFGVTKVSTYSKQKKVKQNGRRISIRYRNTIPDS